MKPYFAPFSNHESRRQKHAASRLTDNLLQNGAFQSLHDVSNRDNDAKSLLVKKESENAKLRVALLEWKDQAQRLEKAYQSAQDQVQLRDKIHAAEMEAIQKVCAQKCQDANDVISRLSNQLETLRTPSVQAKGFSDQPYTEVKTMHEQAISNIFQGSKTANDIILKINDNVQLIEMELGRLEAYKDKMKEIEPCGFEDDQENQMANDDDASPLVTISCPSKACEKPTRQKDTYSNTKQSVNSLPWKGGDSVLSSGTTKPTMKDEQKGDASPIARTDSVLRKYKEMAKSTRHSRFLFSQKSRSELQVKEKRSSLFNHGQRRDASTEEEQDIPRLQQRKRWSAITRPLSSIFASVTRFNVNSTNHITGDDKPLLSHDDTEVSMSTPVLGAMQSFPFQENILSRNAACRAMATSFPTLERPLPELIQTPSPSTSTSSQSSVRTASQGELPKDHIKSYTNFVFDLENFPQHGTAMMSAPSVALQERSHRPPPLPPTHTLVA